MLVCMEVIFILAAFFNCVELRSINDIEDDEMIDLSRFEDGLFGDPSDSVGKMVAEWSISDKINPEELGTYTEGDMLIPKSEGRNGLIRVSSRWDKGILPYVFHSSVPESDRAKFRQAIQIYHSKTCIRIIPRTNEKDYLSVESSNTGCWSSVGRITGKQSLNLQSGGCTNLIGTILHEIMHALGFFHEQNRSDRDKFVRILFQNIKPETVNNFNIASPGETTDYGVRYDEGSVMHYSSTAFSRNGKKTIEAVYGNEALMGQRSGFSQGDLTKLNKMYNCDTSNIGGGVGGNSGGGGYVGGGGGSNKPGFNWNHALGGLFIGAGQADGVNEKAMGQRVGFSDGDLKKLLTRYCKIPYAPNPSPQIPDSGRPFYPEYPEYPNGFGGGNPYYPNYGPYPPPPPPHRPYPPPPPQRPQPFWNLFG